ncbi:Ger(x)C family spore germination protein [Tumebacillus permanentifrigoris]|uniref:Ger(X)C family germination protein n=1 Tax=Tumebacillus permanentifrigoris TaxID=378543 RepID=A0A316D8U9_9BACL|nr:Ger(x)C family spore germination protein [Tumebacillus permanentifrigoris]PWK13406.1 Ger(x)C family germination protein [Tumebacillus permanentifrigoris]
MKSWTRTLLVVLLTSFLLAGCWDFREVEHVIYLNALGVDYVKGQYTLYAQVIDFSNLSKMESGGGRHEDKPAIGKGTGETFDQAAFDLYNTTQQKISWAHISAMVFSDNAIKAGIPEHAIDLMRRYHEMRHTIWTFGTHASLDKLFATTPTLNISTVYSRLNNPEDAYRQSSQIKPIYLNTMISSLKEPAQTTVLPYLTISKTRWKMANEVHEVLRLNGVALILNYKYQGFVGEQLLDGLRWVESGHRRMALFTYDRGKPLSSTIFLAPDCKILPSVEGDQVFFDLQIKAQGSMLEVMQPKPESYLREATEKQIEKEIRQTYEAGLRQGGDILNLGLVLYRKNPTAWHRLQHDAKLPLTKASLRHVQVQVQLKSSGKLKLEE